MVPATLLGGTGGGEEATLIYSYLLISLIKTTRLWNRSVFFWVKQMETLGKRYETRRGAV